MIDAVVVGRGLSGYYYVLRFLQKNKNKKLLWISDKKVTHRASDQKIMICAKKGAKKSDLWGNYVNRGFDAFEEFIKEFNPQGVKKIPGYFAYKEKKNRFNNYSLGFVPLLGEQEHAREEVYRVDMEIYFQWFDKKINEIVNENGHDLIVKDFLVLERKNKDNFIILKSYCDKIETKNLIWCTGLSGKWFSSLKSDESFYSRATEAYGESIILKTEVEEEYFLETDDWSISTYPEKSLIHIFEKKSNTWRKYFSGDEKKEKGRRLKGRKRIPIWKEIAKNEIVFTGLYKNGLMLGALGAKELNS